MKRFVKSGLALCAVLMITINLSAQHVTISNNLLYDTWLTPNARIGLRLSPHWSVGLTGGYRPWPTSDDETRKWRHLLVSPDVRYWTDSVNVHHFFGLNLLYSHYNVADVKFPFGLWRDVRDERRQGDLGAVGLFYGYSWPLARHWNVEALVGAAVGYTRYDRFECGHCGTKLDTGHKLFLLPQAAVNVVFNIPGWPRPAVVEQVVVAQPVAPVPDVTAEVRQKPFVPALSAVPDFTGRAGQLQRDNPVLAHVSEYKPYDRTRILRKEKGALYVHFPVGKSVLTADFRSNRPTLERILDITRQIMADTTSSVQKIQIVGLASIEGGIAANERLAQNRAMALQRYVQQQISIPDSLFDTVGGGEAWAEFRDLLADLANGEAAPAVGEAAILSQPHQQQPRQAELRQALAVIDGESDLDRREQLLRRLNGGRTWQYLKQHVLKDQRNSGYVRIYYDYVPDRAAAAINRASDLLRQGHYAEALAELDAVRADERAQNVLGVALWQTGQREEALRCFRRAADQGNADARENLRQLENK